MKIHRQNQGQTLLIILLIMSVVFTVGLSVISRSVTDVAVSQKEEEAARAFSAAEAGIEQALIAGNLIDSTLGFTATVEGIAQNSPSFILPQTLNAGETAPVWFIEHDSDNNLVCTGSCFSGNTVTLYWGENGTSSQSSTAPAIEAAFVYTTAPDNYSTARIARVAYDTNSTRRSNNSFEAPSGPLFSPSCTIGTTQFAFCSVINNLSNLNPPVTIRPSASDTRGLQMARLRILYNTDKAHPVAIAVSGGNGTIPNQGSKIESTGTSGESTRKIQVNKLFSDLPPIFDFALFSATGGLTK